MTSRQSSHSTLWMALNVVAPESASKIIELDAHWSLTCKCIYEEMHGMGDGSLKILKCVGIKQQKHDEYASIVHP